MIQFPHAREVSLGSRKIYVSTALRGTLCIVFYTGAGPEGTSSKTKGTATSPHSGPALVGSQYFDLWHLKNVKTKFRKKI